MVIEGPGASNLTIEGTGTQGIFNTTEVSTLRLTGLHLTNATTLDTGHYYSAGLDIKDAVITGMSGTAVSSLFVEIDNTVISGNGAGVYAYYGGKISDSVITGNKGYGASTLMTLQIENSRIEGNDASGLILYNTRHLSVKNSTIKNNGGNAIESKRSKYILRHASDRIPFEIDIQTSTISGNGGLGLFAQTGTVEEGGNPYAYGDAPDRENSRLRISNTTIVGNRGGGIAVPVGLGIVFEGSIESSTVAYNGGYQGAGINVSVDPNVWGEENRSNPPLRLHNTIVGGNGTGYNSPDLASDLPAFSVDAGYSLIQKPGSVAFSSSEGVHTNIFNQDPRLGRLQLLGGVTQVRAPEVDSPVINRGDPNANVAITTDQRGAGYPRVAGSQQDMGAVEVQATEIAPVLVATLSDLNGNASPELAAVVRSMNSGIATLKVHDTQTGAELVSAQLSGTGAILDVGAVSDISGNGKQEVAVLRDGAAKVELRDAATGAAINDVLFTAVVAQSLAVLPDLNGNGKSELAVLGRRGGNNVVEVRDAQTGTRLRSVLISRSPTPRDLVALDDINGNGKADFAVVFDDNNPERTDVVELWDGGTGTLLRSFGVPPGREVLKVANMADMNGNGKSEVAVLRAGNGDVKVFDTGTGATLSTIPLDPFYLPLHLDVVPDTNSNGKEEITVLSRKLSDGSLRAEVRDVKTRKLLRTVNFSAFYRPDDFAVLSDINGNGAAELSHAGVNAAGVARSTQKDAVTGAQINVINY